MFSYCSHRIHAHATVAALRVESIYGISGPIVQPCQGRRARASQRSASLTYHSVRGRASAGRATGEADRPGPEYTDLVPRVLIAHRRCDARVL